MEREQASQRFVVEASQAGAALPAALRRWLPGVSWSRVKELIRSRRVLVNDAVCLDEGRRLAPGDRVQVLDRSLAAPPAGGDVVIRYLDRHLVVVEKPAGMRSISHHTERHHSARRRALHPSLQDVLPGLIRRRESVGKERKGAGRPPRLTVVHRLDRDTSGLLVFARTEPAALHLIGQFKRHTIDRVYLAVVPGWVAAQSFDSRLVEDRGDGRRGSTALAGTGKRAITHVTPVDSPGGWESIAVGRSLREGRSGTRSESATPGLSLDVDGRADGTRSVPAAYTLLECRLETGRTHQIRIHLAEAGHPVCGDKRYHQPLFAPAFVDRSGAPRLALHAARLGFEHPATGNRLSFDAPLPADLANWIATLKR